MTFISQYSRVFSHGIYFMKIELLIWDLNRLLAIGVIEVRKTGFYDMIA